MAALPPSARGLPTFDVLHCSFLDVLSTTKPPHASAIPSLVLHLPLDEAQSGTHKGFPSLLFEDANITDLSKPFGYSLIGKFSQDYNKRDPKLRQPSIFFPWILNQAFILVFLIIDIF